MPPRTRTRATKVLKENIDIVKKSNIKSDGKVAKSSRKALADKTNSLSDDNASIDIPIKTSKKTLSSKTKKPNEDIVVRPRRERRLPPRYIENQTLKNLSNNKDSLVKESSVTSKTGTTTKKPPAKEFTTSQDTESLTKQGPSSHLKATPKEKDVASESKKPTKNTNKHVSITTNLANTETRPKRNCRIQSTVENVSKDSFNVSSPFKTPSKDTENSLVANKPKRVCRLPSRFEDNSISPNKFIPVLPCYASTPILQKTSKITSKASNVPDEKKSDAKTKVDKTTNKLNSKPSKSKPTKTTDKCNTSSSSTEKSSPDTNNNGKNKVLRPKRATVITKLQTKQGSPDNKIKPFRKRLLENSLSFRVLEDRKSNEKEDVYEFTFDPNEEPTPRKKKRKRPVKKRQVKPKTVVLKSNYNDNVSKALAHLKTKVKPSQVKSVQSNAKPIENLCKTTENNVKPTESSLKPSEISVKPSENHVKPSNNHDKPTESIETFTQPQTIAESTSYIPQSNYSANLMPDVPPMHESVNSIHASNYASIRIEDIAADFEFSDHHDDINYSPVSSPHHQPIPESHEPISEAPEPNINIGPVNNKDPLNLQEDVSFFEEPPVASSSMNVSIRHPMASPWRVEFGSLPIRWQNNIYLKSNMTPAVESSFINSEATKKKHIYTNMLPEQEPLPEIFEPAPALKQTSIISFIREVAERNANKKKRKLQTPTRAVFDDITGTNEGHSPKKAKIAKDSTPNTSTNNSKDKENSHNSNKSPSPEKKKKDKDCTYFGFDESENVDQENVSPVKVNPNLKPRVLRSRNALKELNTQAVPTRAAMPVSKAKLTSSEVVEQLYDQLKSAEDAQFPVKETAKEPVGNIEATNVHDPSWHDDDDEDSQSVHLFEDIEVVHHMKPHRKSYGKAKKVTFQQSANSDSDSQPVRADPASSDDDLADLSFRLPDIKPRNKRTKKKKPKKLLTKKEEKEVEEWAAGFNSMCEDIDEFPLLVE